MKRMLLIGLALAVLGLALALVSGLAEVIGLGDRSDAFGWKQIVGLAAGLVLLVAGGLLARRAARRSKRSSPEP